MQSRGSCTLRVAYLVLVSLFLTVGCAAIPTGRFDSLAEASRSLRADSAETYARIEVLQRQYMVFNPAEGRLTVDSFKPVVMDEQGQPRDFGLGPRLRFRESVLDVLSDYADALQAFAKKDYQGDLDKATQKLNGGVRDLARQVSGTAEAQKAAGILATAVNGLGRRLIERRRRETLRQAMDEAQPGVEGLAGQLVADNALIAQAVTIMRNGILRAANGMRPGTSSPDRLALDDEVSRIIIDSGEILASLEALNGAVQAIPAAHSEIRETLDQREVNLKQLQTLIAEGKRLNKFNRSLR
jgi:hypothetical protein